MLGLAGTVTTEEDVGVLEVEVILDGDQIGSYASPSPEGSVPALVPASKVGVQPGRHILVFRFDRLTSSPATVSVRARGVYSPSPGVAQEIDLGTRTAMIREGEGLRFDFDL